MNSPTLGRRVSSTATTRGGCWGAPGGSAASGAASASASRARDERAPRADARQNENEGPDDMVEDSRKQPGERATRREHDGERAEQETGVKMPAKGTSLDVLANPFFELAQ